MSIPDDVAIAIYTAIEEEAEGQLIDLTRDKRYGIWHIIAWAKGTCRGLAIVDIGKMAVIFQDEKQSVTQTLTGPITAALAPFIAKEFINYCKILVNSKS